MIVVAQLLAISMKRVVIEAPDVSHFARMKLPLNIIGHAIDHLSFEVWSIVVDEDSFSLEQAILELADKHGAALLDKHSEAMRMARLSHKTKNYIIELSLKNVPRLSCYNLPNFCFIQTC